MPIQTYNCLFPNVTFALVHEAGRIILVKSAGDAALHYDAFTALVPDDAFTAREIVLEIHMQMIPIQ